MSGMRGTVLANVLIAVLAFGSVTAVAWRALDDDEPAQGAHLSRFPHGPVEAIVDLDGSGKKRWGSTLTHAGLDCDLDRVYVLALGYVGDAVDVVTIPGRCLINRLLIAPDDGSVRSEDPMTVGPDGPATAGG